MHSGAVKLAVVVLVTLAAVDVHDHASESMSRIGIINFVQDTGFGNKVLFLPRNRLLWPLRERPLAADMKIGGCSRD